MPSERGVGGTLRIIDPAALVRLNPHLTSKSADVEASRIVYEPLASFDAQDNLMPILAAEVPSLDNGGLAADGKSVTWKLRQDVKWCDGEAFTAEDVRFTYQFIANPDVKSPSIVFYNVIESVEVLDSHTVKVNFKTVNPAWASPFVGPRGVIIPRHVFEPYNGSNALDAPANNAPLGTGPYCAVSPGLKPQEVWLLGAQLVETNKIVFEPNPYFREADKPFFRRIEYRGGGTANEAARLVMRDGGMDFAFGLQQLPPDELKGLEAAGRGKLLIKFDNRVERIALNRTDPRQETAAGERSSLEFPHPFFSDERVRQAFAYAIDRETIAAAYGPAAKLTTNNLAAPPQYNSPNRFYNFDLSKATSLLDEAGWKVDPGDGIRYKDGVKMKVVFQAQVGPAQQQAQQIVKETLESIGVEVELKMVAASNMIVPGASNPDSLYRFNADMMLWSLATGDANPAIYMQFWTCKQIPQQANNWAGLNVERWCNPEYDALLQQSTSELDPEKRAQLFIQMNDMLVKDVVMIPLIHQGAAQGVGLNIEGVELTSWDMSAWAIKDWRQVLP